MLCFISVFSSVLNLMEQEGWTCECSVYTEHLLQCSRTWADIQQTFFPPRKKTEGLLGVNTGPLFPLPWGRVLGEPWTFPICLWP